MNSLLKRTFDSEAEYYDVTTQFLLLDYDKTINRIVDIIPFRKYDRFTLLDLGCGTGTLINRIKEHFPNASIMGLDFSEEMLNIAREKNGDCVDYTLCNILSEDDWPLSHFDVIVSSFVFHNFLSMNEHDKTLSRIYEHLSVDGKLILADLIDLDNVYRSKEIKNKLIDKMRRHGLCDDDIVKWLGILELEDSPLTIKKNLELLNRHGLKDVSIETFDSNISIFFASKVVDPIQVKSELIIKGVRLNECVKKLFLEQNPNEVWKTGNNGVFINIDNMSALVSMNHKANKSSPYEINEDGNEIYLTKWGKKLDIRLTTMQFPEWFLKKIPQLNNRCFSEFFVYEGDGYLHLAYKKCSFSKEEKCKFCSTLRREQAERNNLDELRIALDYVLDDIPDETNICLGGGTYLPLSDNVEYFKEIIKCIRAKNSKIPIWIEMIPPSIQQIEELIDCGATSFGFNIEIWDDNLRKKICPGKSTYSKEHYLEACDFVLEKLGPNRVGSCLIVGLDHADSIKKAIDEMISHGIEPCLLPYKTYNRTNLAGYSVPQTYQYDFILLSRYVAKQAKLNGIMFENNQGCLRCSCCTIMHDYQKNY